MEPFLTLRSPVAPLPRANVDTDQIIPASYLKVTGKTGLGRGLFANWRYLADGSPDPDFVLNQPRYEGSRILLAGENFGCGSSREHAAWALLDHGFRAVLSTRFADIFRANAAKNGLLAATVASGAHRKLLELALSGSGADAAIDLEASTVAVAGAVFELDVDPFARRCLLQGVDELGYLLERLPAIEAYEDRRTSGSGRGRDPGGSGP